MSLSFVCPLCKGPLTLESEAYECRRCNRRFPIVLGIPDFRVFPDPYISFEDDYQKARALDAGPEGVDFPQIVARYWEMTPGVPSDLVRAYVRGVVNSRDRAMRVWSMARDKRSGSGGTLLDVGCGAGGLIAVASRDVAQAVGFDIALRWLVIARKRFIEAGLANVQLVCGCAEHLPFADEVFDVAMADDVLDHARDPHALVRESARVLRRGEGIFSVSTPNRYSLAPDPHVWTWGVGFLPAGLRDHYVRRLRGIPYGPIAPISYLQLRSYLRRPWFSQCEIILPSLRDSSPREVTPWWRLLAAMYERLRQTWIGRGPMLLVAPVLQAVCRRSERPMVIEDGQK